MSKIKNPVVLIYKRENSDTYAVAITSGSQNFHDAVLMATMEPDMIGDDVDTWSKTGYYMAAELEQLREKLKLAEEKHLHLLGVVDDYDWQRQRLHAAAEKVIRMNRLEALHRTGCADNAENYACVRELRDALEFCNNNGETITNDADTRKVDKFASTESPNNTDLSTRQITASMAKDIAFKLSAELKDEESEMFAEGYNAALLQGKSEPVYPDALPCAVELKPGLIIGKGCKTEILLNALQRRADYCAKLAAMTPEERSKYDANIEAFKAMLPVPVVSASTERTTIRRSAEHKARLSEASNLLTECGLVNDVTTGKPLTITLPDITSKAFWIGTRKSETFHSETYKRWVKEAIERACVIAGIGVVVK